MTPEQFRIFAECLPEPMLMLTTMGAVLAANQAALLELNVSREQLSGHCLNDFVAEPAEDIAKNLRLWSRNRKMVPGVLTFRARGGLLAYRVEGGRLLDPDSTAEPKVVIRLTRQDAAIERFADLNRQLAEAGKEIHRRTQAEEMARQEKERLRVTLHSIGDGVIVTDLDGRVVSLNPVAESLTGWSNADAAGEPLEVVFHIVNETTRQLVENPAVRALCDGMIVGLANHTILIAKDGAEWPIDDSAAPIKNDFGETVGVVLVFRDVVERKRVEQAERKNSEIFRLVHQIGKIGHWEWNADKNENQWSPEIEALYGLKPGGFEGGYEGWAKLLHPDDLPRAEADVKRAFETGHYFSEFRVVWPDGSIHWLETRARVFQDPDGRAKRIVGVNMDISDKKQQEQELRESEKRWRTMAETLPNLVWTDLPDGQCDWLSSQWRHYTGFPEDELLGIEWLNKVVHPDDRERTLACWQAACADAGTYDVEYRIRRHDGQYRWFKTRGLPVRGDQGNIVYWFGTCTDVEDFKRLEESLREADRRKDEFLATLAHELRNPLAPIRNSLEVVKRAPINGEVAREAYGVMGRQLNQMVRLIDDLLDISRISRGKLAIQVETVELAEVLRHALETCRPLIEDAGHQVDVKLPAQPVLLKADFARLSQVFSNLLNNACKFTPTGGKIKIMAAAGRSEVVISLADSGIGIPKEKLNTIFEIFSQVDSSLDRSHGGLGIGLALVREVVQMHGGDVQAKSEGLGTGSEFVVRLPTIQHEPLNKPMTDKPLKPSGKYRILVVDDNVDSAMTMSMLLKISGHETQTAHDGLEAVQVSEAFRPDVILLDIGLPKLNGYEACRKIRERSWGREIVIVALTGWGQEDDRRKSREAGFNEHLVKPVEHTELATLLTELIRDPTP